MDEEKLRQAADAIAKVAVFSKHQIGEIETVTLRDLLEDVCRLGDAIPIEDTLLEMAKAAVTAYQREPD